jgi:hypothetical protein
LFNFKPVSFEPFIWTFHVNLTSHHSNTTTNVTVVFMYINYIIIAANTDNTFGAIGFVSRLIPSIYPISIIRVNPETCEPIRNAEGLCTRCNPGMNELVATRARVPTHPLSYSLLMYFNLCFYNIPVLNTKPY